MSIIYRTLNKIINNTDGANETLLDLSNDTVAPGNLAKSETAHNNEGESIVGRFLTEDAEAWAVGMRDGVPVGSEDITYHNNSKWYSEVSETAKEITASCMRMAGIFADSAEESSIICASILPIVRGCEENAEDYAIIAGSSMRIAGNYAEESEAHAVGKRGGVDVPSTDPTYHNNAKYWADYASQYAQGGLIYKGSILFANIPTTGMVLGDMYNMEDDFTTDSRFQEGAGVFVKAGTNIAWNGNKWDVLATGGGTGTGGHTIVDEEGTTYPARAKLKFVNATVTDDSTNDTTIVEAEGGGGGTTIVQKPTVTIGIYTYDGTQQAPTITGLDTENCNITGTYEATNAGSYTFTIALKNTAKMVWNDLTTADLVYTWSIGKASVSAPTVTNTSKIFNGSAQSPTITRDTSKTTILGDYSVTNAGSYTFSIALSDKDNYLWTDSSDTVDKSYSWSIAILSVTAPTVTDISKKYTGSAMSPTITRDTTWTSISGDYSETSEGSYTFTIVLNDKDNCEWADTSDTTDKTYTWLIYPSGELATPINDIQTWLHCAVIYDKNYTTISQVLSDSTTLAALMLDNNAVDYLVRSTSWVSNITGNQTAMTDIGADNYCANTLLADSTWRTAIINSSYSSKVLNFKVPTMTSNTSPSGTAFAQHGTSSGSQAAYTAFDKIYTHSSSSFGPNSGIGTSSYCGYIPTKEYTLLTCNVYMICGRSGGISFNLQVQGSNTGNSDDWHDLSSAASFSISKDTVTKCAIPITTIAAYQRHRVYISSSTNLGAINSYATHFVEIEFTGRQDI